MRRHSPDAYARRSLGRFNKFRTLTLKKRAVIHVWGLSLKIFAKTAQWPCRSRIYQEARQLATQAKSQISAIKKFLDRQHEAAEELSRAITNTGIAYRALLENGEKAKAVALLPGMSWPHGTDYSRKSLDKLVALELYRLTGRSNMNGNDCLPKPHCEVRYNMQPQVIPPLIDELKSWHDHIMAALTGKEAV